jgi:iron complex outermembrane receptor protein/vitamin B12 transporter
MKRLVVAWLGLVAVASAHGVIVRGKVTGPLGEPLPGARVQLIQGPKSVADAIAGVDGGYEIRTEFEGRFVLLVAPSAVTRGYAPQIGEPFYGSKESLVTIDVALNRAGITPQVSKLATQVERPVKQLAVVPVRVEADELLTWAEPDILPVREYLLERGAPTAAVETTVDGVEANTLGGMFNLKGISTTTLGVVDSRATLELAGNRLAVNGVSPRGVGPSLVYSGDAGTLGALRNEVEGSYVRGRVDGLAAFSRFGLADAAPNVPSHLITWAGVVGYHVSAGTSLIGRVRYDESVGGLNSPFGFYGVVPQGKVAAQNLLGRADFDTKTAGGWHNEVQYGVVRERGQTYDFATPATGVPVTIVGGNGYAATGTAVFRVLPSRLDTVTNRDAVTYQTDKRFKQWLMVVGKADVDAERGASVLPAGKRTLDRTHAGATVEFDGDVRHRLFYEAAGTVDHAQQMGWTGGPRFGLSYAAVRPGQKWLRGTMLRAQVETRARETSLLEQDAVPGAGAPRQRTMESTVEQNIRGEKLTVRAEYFHAQYSHEFERLAYGAGGMSQTLALRTQGVDVRLRYLPVRRLLVDGGYGYLASLTEQSSEVGLFNPALPKIAIGGLSALRGQRPFGRPPETGYFRVEWSGRKLNAAVQGGFAGKNDGTTGLVQTPGLLLPNRNLSPGYGAVDAHVSYVVAKQVTWFTQMTNLTDDRRTGTLGYVGTPFLLRMGLRVRIGGE